MFALVPATEAHALDLASHISDVSGTDCLMLGNDPCRQSVDNLRTSVYAFAGLSNDRCFCLFGVIPDFLAADHGQPWLLTADEMPPARAAMARVSRQYIPYVSQRFTYLYGWVNAENQTSVKWLRWLGYTVYPGAPYRRFDWRAECRSHS